MKRLRVSDGLQVVAGECNAPAGQVAQGAPPASGPSSQPTAAAMKIGHACVRQAAAAMSARMEATGTDIAFADISYHETEARSALKLSAVTSDR